MEQRHTDLAVAHHLEQLGDIGISVQSIARILRACQQIAEAGECEHCAEVQSVFTSGYVLDGLTIALDELGSTTSNITDGIKNQLADLSEQRPIPNTTHEQATAPSHNQQTHGQVNDGHHHERIRALDISDCIAMVDVALEHLSRHRGKGKADKHRKSGLPRQADVSVTQALMLSKRLLAKHHSQVLQQ